MPLKIDLHCHSFFSGDGISSPEELIEAARRKGLHGFALTDHNNCEGVEYMIAQGLIRPDGQPVNGILVIPGVEVTTGDGHLLCIGTTLPDMNGAPVADVCRAIHCRGGLAIPAHPFDLFRSGISESAMDSLEIDAIEVFNSATTLRRYNRKALDYARRRGLPMIAGSDAHHQTALGTAFTILDTNDFSLQGALRQIPGKNTRSERYLTATDTIRKTWNNWLRLKRRRPEAG